MGQIGIECDRLSLVVAFNDAVSNILKKAFASFLLRGIEQPFSMCPSGGLKPAKIPIALVPTPFCKL
jgi:hypothetical protein